MHGDGQLKEVPVVGCPAASRSPARLGSATRPCRRLGAFLLPAAFLAITIAVNGSDLAGRRFVFRNYGTAQGLADLTVTALAQDDVGFIWVGTQDGLYRFDGQRFDRFGCDDGLPSSYVHAVHFCRDGALWVGTNLGLALRVGDRFVAYGPEKGLLAESIPPQGIASSPDGMLVVATVHGLSVMKGNEFVPVHSQPLPGRPTAVLAAGGGVIWFGDASGRVGRIAGGELEVWGAESGLPSERVDGLLLDGNGSGLWARTANHLLVRHSPDRPFVDLSDGVPPSSYFGSLALDSAGGLWVPTDFGIAHLARGAKKCSVVGREGGLTASAVNAFLQDREGLLWCGLAGAGLDCWLGYPDWTCFTAAEGLVNESIWSISRDSAGTLWVGTDAGVSRFDPAARRWRSWTGSLPGTCAYAMVADPRSGVWVGFYPGGVCHIDPRSGNVNTYGPGDGLLGDRVWDLMLAADGALWVATTEGLYLGSRTEGHLRFSPVAIPGANGSEAIWALLRDKEGRIWVGGQHGVSRLEGGTWRRFTTRDGLRHDDVAYLAQAGDGAIWMGYYEAVGASRLVARGEKLEIQNFDTSNGLASNSTQALICDPAGRVWIGTSRGVTLLEGGRMTSYSDVDGLVWQYVNALWGDPDGGLWIGTGKGLAHFAHARQPRTRLSPNVVLLSARLGGQIVPLERAAHVGHKEGTFEITFTGLSFRRPDETLFRYRLIGLEETSTETSLREARYPKLPPGNYAFEVSCRNSSGIWSPTPARFEFSVSSPWYRTPVAMAFACIGIVFLIVAAYRARMGHAMEIRRKLEDAVARRTEELQREKRTVEEQSQALLAASEERRRFYAMLVHDLKNPLTPIIGGLEIVESEIPQESGAGQRAIEVMRNAAARMRFLIETYVAALRTAVVEDRPELRDFRVYDMVSDLALSYGPAAQKRGLDLLIDGDLVDERWALSRGGCLVRAPADAVYRAVENLLSNALKYAATEIRLRVDETHKRQVGLIVENDGPTISDADKERIFGLYEQLDNSKPGSGVGLASARRQVEAIGGKLLVRDIAPSGVRFEIWIPRSDRTGDAGDETPTPAVIGV